MYVSRESLAMTNDNEQLTSNFDICIIGAGSGGLSIAAGAAKLGFHVCLIERAEMGGDCLNTGCVPSKSLLSAANAAHGFRTAHKFGIEAQEPNIDFAAVKDHVQDVIKQIQPHDSQERFEGLGVHVIRESAKFISSKELQAGTRTIKAKYFIIATGSRPAIPSIQGLDATKVYTNETIFDLKVKPDHLIIIGGGPIGIEMAQAHHRLGCKVSVVEAQTILPKDDPELVQIAYERLEFESLRLIQHAEIISVEHKDDKVIVHMKHEGSNRQVTGSHLLIAAGRTPNIESLDLEAAGIKCDKKGVTTDNRLRTNHKHIFAIGDVAGAPQFTHVAGYHAGIVIKNIMFKIPAKVDYSALPWVTYTDPEIAQVGLSEQMAVDKYGINKINVVKWRFDENDRARTDKRTDGLLKVITLKNGHIIGASIIGKNAGELLQIWSLAISQKMKIKALTNMITPYPTYSEINKRAAGAYFENQLFSDRTRSIIQFLQKIPFLK